VSQGIFTNLTIQMIKIRDLKIGSILFFFPLQFVMFFFLLLVTHTMVEHSHKILLVLIFNMAMH
jgi:hypothetical protein